MSAQESKIAENCGSTVENHHQMIAEGISRVGYRLVNCPENCVDINRNLKAGILPRCLILETKGRHTERGSVIVGINPAPSGTEEREFYRTNGLTYDSLRDYWNQRIRNIRYYKLLRAFVDELHFDGPVLWTELAKCENQWKNHLPGLQTFRICIANYLSEELALIPDDWPVIAVSKKVFKRLAYMYPKRTIIGIPHSTARYNTFLKLFENWKTSPKLREGFVKPYEFFRDGSRGKAVWANVEDGWYDERTDH